MTHVFLHFSLQHIAKLSAYIINVWLNTGRGTFLFFVQRRWWQTVTSGLSINPSGIFWKRQCLLAVLFLWHLLESLRRCALAGSNSKLTSTARTVSIEWSNGLAWPTIWAKRSGRSLQKPWYRPETSYNGRTHHKDLTWNLLQHAQKNLDW